MEVRVALAALIEEVGERPQVALIGERERLRHVVGAEVRPDDAREAVVVGGWRYLREKRQGAEHRHR